MEKDLVINIVNEYLKVYNNEHEKIKPLINYLSKNSNTQICDWNNVNGHLTAGGFIYASDTRHFLVLWHKDLEMYLYPGGHCEANQTSPLDTAKAEIVEETGLTQFKVVNATSNPLIPLDIDIHEIPYNARVNMPSHYHFDFRYLFVVDNQSNIVIDENEISNYKWINEEELTSDKNYGKMIEKIKKFI